MIRISCTNCKTVLSIDDAFAGGVCRCQHCGTIQTVPSQARATAQVVTSGQSMGGSKSVYQGDTREGTGLEDLAGAVVSSGLSSSRLTRSAGSANGKAGKPNLMPLVIAATVIVALLLVIIVILMSRSSSSSATSVNANLQNTQNSSGAGSSKVASFCGTPLSGNSTIYLLDCGSSMGEFLGDLKDATVKSLHSLGSDRKFQVLFWNNGTDGAYPENATTYATDENISAAQKAIDDVAPFGQSDVKTALQLAINQHPDVIVIATGKGWDLNEAWLDSVMAIRGSAPVKIDTYSLGSNGESAPLKKLAAQTGGTYHELTQAELRALGQ